MAWTPPFTAVDGNTLTAAAWNSGVRDNLNETAPGKATTAGGYFVATGTNAIAQRVMNDATVATQEDTTSTTYTNLSTVGPSVTLTTGTSALVVVTAMIAGPSVGNSCHADFEITGATSRSADDATALRVEHDSNEFNRASVITRVSLTAGSNTFTMKYKTGTAATTARFRDRNLIVIPF